MKSSFKVIIFFFGASLVFELGSRMLNLAVAQFLLHICAAIIKRTRHTMRPFISLIFNLYFMRCHLYLLLVSSASVSTSESYFILSGMLSEEFSD